MYERIEKELGDIFTSADSEEKTENANVDGHSTMGMMLHVGELVSKEYALDHLISHRFSQAHRDGQVYIHDLGWYAEGTTVCLQQDIEKTLKGGFHTGHGYLREPGSIGAAATLSAIAIQSNQSEQMGGQSLAFYDRAMVPYVVKTFKKELKKQWEYLDLNQYIEKPIDDILKEINSVNDNIYSLVDYFWTTSGDDQKLQNIVLMAYNNAYKETIKATYQAMEGLIHNLNTLASRAGAQVPFSSINLGLDTSPEGRMVTESLLRAHMAGLGNGETPIFPIIVYTVKEGVNLNPEDPNHDLFKLAMECSSKRLYPTYAFVDAPHNLPFYEADPYHGAVQTINKPVVLKPI